MIETRKPLTPEARALTPLENVEYRPVRLADGLEWPLPFPATGFAALVREDGTVGIKTCAGTMPEGYEEFLDIALGGAEYPENVRAIFGMAVLLVRSSYDVTNEELSKLVRIGPGAAHPGDLYDHCIGRTSAKN